MGAHVPMTQCAYCVRGQVLTFLGGDTRCAQCARRPGKGLPPPPPVPSHKPAKVTVRGYLPPDIAAKSPLKPKRSLVSPTSTHLAERWRNIAAKVKRK